MVQTQKVSQSGSRFFHRHAAIIPSIRLRIQKACLTGLKLQVGAIEGEVKVQLKRLMMITPLDGGPGEFQDHVTDGAMLQNLHQMVSTVMFQASEVEEALATVVAGVLVKGASVGIETVKAREWATEDPGRPLKNSTQRWMITGEALGQLKLKAEMALVRQPPPLRLLGMTLI